jgi:hypothetical protein
VLSELFTGRCFQLKFQETRKYGYELLSIVPRTWILTYYSISSTAERIRDGMLKYIFITKESIGDGIHWVAFASQVFKLHK